MPDDDRKARLKALAARAGRTKQPVEGDADATTSDDIDEGSKKKPALKFRNYAPQDDNLDTAGKSGDDLENNDASSSQQQPASKKPRIDSGGGGEGNEGGAVKSSKMALQEALQEAQIEMKVTSNNTAKATTGTGTVDVKSVAPQKIDADLKRGIADKLAKLERRTQRSIVEMLKERLELEAEREVDGEDDDDDGSDLD